MTKAVFINGGRVNYVQNVSASHHLFQSDEPVEAGGLDLGPDPYDLLLAALGSCIGITLRMYAERKGWPLGDVRTRLTYARVHAEDCSTCDGEPKLIDTIEVELSLVGDLSDDQRRRFMEIAEKCPVHRTLTSPIRIRTRPAPRTADASVLQTK
jgi:putative redox protein